MIKKIIAGAFALIMIGAVVAGVIALAQGPEEGRGGLGRGQGRQGAALDEAAPDGVTQARGGRGNGGGQEPQAIPQAEGDHVLVQTRGGQRKGGQGQGQGQSQDQGQGQSQNGAGSGVPQADVQPEDWRTVEGTAVALSDLVIELADGTTLQVGLGPEHYRQAQGFVLEIGQRVVISGFDEDGEFMAGRVENLDTGETIVLRSVDGRPMWAGQGQGRNRV